MFEHSELQDQVEALVARQGVTLAEVDLLSAAVESYEPVVDSGVNETYRVALASGTVAYHKPFIGASQVARTYGHAAEQAPINECAAWRLAAALGEPVSGIVAVCVLRTCGGEPGSLSAEVPGEPYADSPSDLGELVTAAAFFDALSAQQDRHGGNWFFDGDTLGLIDHGYGFARPGDLYNHSAFVTQRAHAGDLALYQWEHDALDRLLASSDLLGMRAILPGDRAEALARRAQRMATSGMLLGPGDF